mmetsp:Transcript_4955/g.13446  ORF Transcript_4955/g.13446 Transcript_4955/m.13446 type:complete len:349 (-) Transcript_4955:1033-2079(-)
MVCTHQPSLCIYGGRKLCRPLSVCSVCSLHLEASEARILETSRCRASKESFLRDIAVQNSRSRMARSPQESTDKRIESMAANSHLYIRPPSSLSLIWPSSKLAALLLLQLLLCCPCGCFFVWRLLLLLLLGGGKEGRLVDALALGLQHIHVSEHTRKQTQTGEKRVCDTVGHVLLEKDHNQGGCPVHGARQSHCRPADLHRVDLIQIDPQDRPVRNREEKHEAQHAHHRQIHHRLALRPAHHVGYARGQQRQALPSRADQQQAPATERTVDCRCGPDGDHDVESGHGCRAECRAALWDASLDEDVIRRGDEGVNAAPLLQRREHRAHNDGVPVLGRHGHGREQRHLLR